MESIAKLKIMDLKDNLISKTLFYLHPLIILLVFMYGYRAAWTYLKNNKFVKGDVSWGIYTEIQFYIIVVLTILLLLFLCFFSEKINKIYAVYLVINVLIIGFFLHHSFNRFMFISCLFILSTAISFILGRLILKYGR